MLKEAKMTLKNHKLIDIIYINYNTILISLLLFIDSHFLKLERKHVNKILTNTKWLKKIWSSYKRYIFITNTWQVLFRVIFNEQWQLICQTKSFNKYKSSLKTKIPQFECGSWLKLIHTQMTQIINHIFLKI